MLQLILQVVCHCVERATKLRDDIFALLRNSLVECAFGNLFANSSRNTHRLNNSRSNPPTHQTDDEQNNQTTDHQRALNEIECLLLALQVVNQIQLIHTGQRYFDLGADNQTRMRVCTDLEFGGLVDQSTSAQLNLAAKRLADNSEIQVARNRALQQGRAGLTGGSEQCNQASLILRLVLKPRHNRVD